MNRLARKIAWRYLFSKKSHSAINAISIVSVCGVAITTLALVCTLSVYNGFTELIGSLYSQIDPQIKITPLQGKTLDTEEEAIEQIAEWNEVKTFTPVIEENALCIYKDRQRPVLVKGVPDNYTELSHIQDIVTSGTFQLNDGRIDYVSLGIGVAGQLGVVANSPYPVELYVPNRLGKVNLANPSQSFNGRRIFVSSTFCANQAIYDDQLAVIPLSIAREMFSYTTEATAIELRLTPTTDENEFAKKLREHLGDAYRVATHIQQNDWYKWVQIEKWITFLILSFILMIATFNVIGALSMLIIDKKRDIDTLQNLGADDRLISKIFLVEVAHFGYRGWFGTHLGSHTLLSTTRIWNTEIGQFRRRVYYRRLSGEAGTPRHAGSHSHRPHFGICDRLVSGQISEKKTSDSQTKRTITYHPPSRHVTRPISSYDETEK